MSKDLQKDREFQQQLAGWRAEYRPAQRLSDFASLGVGGEADVIILRDHAALEPLVAGLLNRGMEWRLLGGGTNILPVDEPFERVFLHLAPGANDWTVEGRRVRVSAAASLGRTVMHCAKQDLGGMEGLSGVPGSVGGALRMNAGAYGTQIGSAVRTITVFRGATGRVEDLTPSDIGFQYRHTTFAPDDIMLSVELELTPRPFAEIMQDVKRCNEKRRSSQPIKEKSAGCIFKNPPGLSTGRLIDELGMKGAREGGAVISERHANFIVNRDHGTAADIFRLMDRIRDRIRAAHGIELEEEVIVWKN